MAVKQYDLVVIGSGPGGEVGAIRAAQLGLKVALIEKNEHLGGTCLNVGCIPTKALLESSKTYDKLQHLEELGFDVGKVKYDWSKIMGRKDKIVDQQRKGLKFLMKKNKIDVFHGTGSFKDAHTIHIDLATGKTEEISTKSVLLATGSKVRELPFAEANHKNILTSDSILFIDRVPKSMTVIGGGIVGMEFASLFGRFGCKVDVVELAPHILPTEDGEVVKEFTRAIKKQNVKLHEGTKFTKLVDNGKDVTVELEGKDAITSEIVLLSIGRSPVTDNLGLDKIGLDTDRGFIDVDEHYRTKIPHIYAIGDILKTPALAHTASAEAHHAVEVIAGHHPQVINYDANPGAVYTYPEIASIGMTEEQLKEKGVEYGVGKFPFAPMAKAKIEGGTDGFVKILYDLKFKEVLGVHIIGAKATEMIAEFVVGKVLETTVDELGQAIHPHPTVSETAMEAVHAALGGAIHM